MQLLDLILIVLMLISGLLALMRGFTREILSLFAWIIAAFAAWYATQMPPLVDLAHQFIAQKQLAIIVTGAAAFLLVLLVMSVITVKIGDWVLDSAIGSFDRTLGGFYGLLRGLVLVTIAYMAYIAFVPPEKRADWIEKAKLKPLIVKTANVIVDFLPEHNARLLREQLRPSAIEDDRAGTIDRADRQRLDTIINGGAN